MLIKTMCTHFIFIFLQHKYHPKCIAEWLGVHNTCPMCRRRIVHRRVMGGTTATHGRRTPDPAPNQVPITMDASLSATTETASTQVEPVTTNAAISSHQETFGVPITRSRTAAQSSIVTRRITRQMSRKMQQDSQHSNQN